MLRIAKELGLYLLYVATLVGIAFSIVIMVAAVILGLQIIFERIFQ